MTATPLHRNVDDEDIPPPPEHLKERSAEFWRTIVENYDLRPADLERLRQSCESIDIIDAAREQLDRDGLTLEDRFGQTRQHPLVNVERDARAELRRSLRELDLDADVVAPTRLPGR
jgi:P27 family predicted phage terminase small subunit